MAGFSLLTNLDADAAIRALKKAARHLEFSVTPVNDREFSVEKGSALASVVLGGLAARCNFRVSIEDRPEKRIEIVLERNHPWWFGSLGVNRIKGLAKEFVDKMEQALIEERGEILKREAF